MSKPAVETGVHETDVPNLNLAESPHNEDHPNGAQLDADHMQDQSSQTNQPYHRKQVSSV